MNATAKDIEIAAGLRTVIHRLVKVLRKHTRNDEMLSLTERSTLGLLYQHGQLLPTELAQIEKVTAQSMSQVIANLSKIAYVDKTPAVDDKRKVYLSLTPAGKEYIERQRQEKQEWLARTLHERLSAREKELLSEAITILTKLMDE
ncbi:MAG: MarR family transcriptional regulator [Chitinophagaceae bacterium]|nr:MarR family transcriptional regulator [Chitinophagaceae bacterium]